MALRHYHTPGLLDLPTEIRDNIWRYSFANLDITPETVFNPDRHHCEPCGRNQLRPIWCHTAIRPLLTCKQIWREASDIFFPGMHVHVASYDAIKSTLQRDTKQPLSKVHTLSLYLHLDEDNRQEWSVALLMILEACPNLKRLDLHNHMRPPTSYEFLTDAVFFGAPLAMVDLTTRGVRTNIHYDYIFEDVIFATVHLGDIKCSDALEEHSSVVRDLIADPEFKAAAPVQAYETMITRLVAIARQYEQPWLERLQRKRLAELEAMAAAERRREEEAMMQGPE
jgi:hypothetical protein